VKANGNLAVLRLLAQAGAGADIVSGGELHRARLAGIPGERIVFSGVGKTITSWRRRSTRASTRSTSRAKGSCARSELAVTMKARAPIALRVNPDVETKTPHHYTATGPQADEVRHPVRGGRAPVPRRRRMPGIRVRGVDVHIGSQILDVEPYRLAVTRILELVDRLRASGIDLEFIDVGGGFGISYDEESGPVTRPTSPPVSCRCSRTQACARCSSPAATSSDRPACC
jgi:diaminopimelate decarboxylase